MTTTDQQDWRIDLKGPVDEPSYAACLDWMRALPETTSATFDFWSRGNFIRRLIHNRALGVRPVLVPAADTDHMRFAYRRLALAGIAVDFLYTGPISKPGWVDHLAPLTGVPVDAGWGYILFGGTVTSPTGRDFAPILGAASLMPQAITHWVAEEAYRPFLAGRLCVAPAELVGLSRLLDASQVNALAHIAGGTSVAEPADSMPSILDLEMPWVDGMTPGDFEQLLSDHEPELADFRAAFASLMNGYYDSVADADAARGRFQSAVEDLLRSASQQQLRNLISKCRGALRTFPLAMGVLAVAGAAYSADPFAGSAILAGAAKVLHDLWKQARGEAHESARGPLRLVLRLGMKTPKFRAPSVRSPVPHDVLEHEGRLHPCHWLCPPTSGLRAIVRAD
jgi:hypothetical protein